MELPTEHTTSQDARPILLALGLPTFGLAFAITVLTTYGPSVLLSLTHSPAKVGALIGGEGAFALAVPLIAGVLSDRMIANGGRFGPRMPFILVGAPLAGAGLILLPFAPNYQLAGAFILAIFIGYYIYYPPYRALYADLLPKRLLPRAQSSQAIMRGAGLGLALIAGGLLLSAWTPLPFVLGTATLLISTLALKPIFRLQQEVPPTPVDEDDDVNTGDLLLHHRGLQIFAIANAIWEYSFAGLKVFIVLYVTKGLGKSASMASAFIAVVAIAYVVGAPIASRLAERYGIVRVMEISALIYGTLLCVGIFPTSVTPMMIVLPFGAIAGSILMTLPQALAFTIAPDTAQGAAAGLVDFSRGVGVVLGPVLVGAAVTWSRSWLSGTHGYAVMWLMIGAPIVASLALLRMLRSHIVTG